MSRSLLFGLFSAALIIIPAATANAGKDSGIELHASPRLPEQVAPSFRGEGRLLSEAELFRKETLGRHKRRLCFESPWSPPPKTLAPRAVATLSKEGAGPAQQNLKNEDQGIAMHVMPRTPEQAAAFYEARGFPRNAIEALTQSCFVTISFHNRSGDVAWLELSRWRFVDEHGREVKRRDRAYWNALWEKLGVPMANRATFGWTQLPEVRDLQPSEPVGGNVALLPPPGRFRIEARFATGAHKQGEDILVTLDNLSCPGRKIK